MDNFNIREIFKTFLKLTKINFGVENYKTSTQDDSRIVQNPRETNLNQHVPNTKLRRNLSAYGRLKSLPKKVNGGKDTGSVNRKDIFEALENANGHKKLAKVGSTGPPSNAESPSVSPNPVGDVKFLGFNFSPFGSPKGPKNPSANGKPAISFEKSPKRSRSLIRRSSHKVKQQIQNVHNPDDCVVS